jgi:hypothetical protein
LSRNQTQLILSITRVRNIETGMEEGGRGREEGGEESHAERVQNMAKSVHSLRNI